MASVPYRSLLGRCIRGFVLPVLEYCSSVWCSAAETHLTLLNRAVCGARFLTGGVFECDIADRRSVEVLCMLYKIRCKPMHPHNGALHGPYVPCGLHAVLFLHLGILMSRLAEGPRNPAGFLFPSQCPSGTILLTPYSMVWDRRVSRAGPMPLCCPKLLYSYYSLLLSIRFSSLSMGWYSAVGNLGSSE